MCVRCIASAYIPSRASYPLPKKIRVQNIGSIGPGRPETPPAPSHLSSALPVRGSSPGPGLPPVSPPCPGSAPPGIHCCCCYTNHPKAQWLTAHSVCMYFAHKSSIRAGSAVQPSSAPRQLGVLTHRSGSRCWLSPGASAGVRPSTYIWFFHVASLPRLSADWVPRVNTTRSPGRAWFGLRSHTAPLTL